MFYVASFSKSLHCVCFRILSLRRTADFSMAHTEKTMSILYFFLHARNGLGVLSTNAFCTIRVAEKLLNRVHCAICVRIGSVCEFSYWLNRMCRTVK